MVSLLPINNMKTACASPLFAVAVLFCGCRSPAPTGNLALFQEIHPSEAARYEVLAPTSVEYMEYSDNDHHETVKSIIQGVRQCQGNPEKLTKYLDHLEKVNDCTDRQADPEWLRFKEHLRDGDLIVFFKYKEGAYNDFGLLVLRDGSIRYRSVWGWNLSQSKSETNAPPPGMSFDRL